MERSEAGKIITGYMKQIFAFAVSRCANIQDAEDLAQDICLKVYRALICRGDISNTGGFIWAAAHNMLANYYRGKKISGIGVYTNGLYESLPAGGDVSDELLRLETEHELHGSIANLSKLQREIVVAYYYENMKQNEIAARLCIPEGTVKWHLFEAKKDLKRGMEKMRSSGELKFNPIKFEMIGTNGSIGTMGNCGNFLRSALAQNIAYCVRTEAKTAAEIAHALGVSPVYAESEAEYLAEYCFLLKTGDKYLANILIDEADGEIIRMQSEMYEKAAGLFADELCDKLENSGIFGGNEGIICNPAGDGSSDRKKRKNFLMWSLIPYIAAMSGESLMDGSITFEQAATLRPDGGQNICYASVLTPGVEPPKYFKNMKEWYGPCWNSSGKYTLWSVDSEWSGRRKSDMYQEEAQRALTLLGGFYEGARLSADECAWLAGHGYISVSADKKTVSPLIIRLTTEMKAELLGIGDRIKESHRAEFEALKAPFVRAVLEATPPHLRTMQKFGLQYIFYADGWFLLHCVMRLVETGRLKPPDEEEKRSLTTILFPN